MATADGISLDPNSIPGHTKLIQIRKLTDSAALLLAVAAANAKPEARVTIEITDTYVDMGLYEATDYTGGPVDFHPTGVVI